MLAIYSPNQFIEKAKVVRTIIFFGAGKRLDMFWEQFAGKIEPNKIACIIDNDKNKHGMLKQLGEKEVPILPVEMLEKYEEASSLILITCANYSEILLFLGSSEKFCRYDYCCMSFFPIGEHEEAAVNQWVPEDFKLSKEALIPKKIHYCWFGNSPIPDQYKYWMESWHKFCPDYEIIEWNESNYNISKNNYMLQAYESKKWGFVSDYARLDIVYQQGGIYLDTDVELIANLDDLLYQKAFAGFESAEYVALGLGFGAVKGLEIIKEMRDDYENRSFIQENGAFDLTSCPVIQTSFLEKLGLVKNGKYQRVADLTIYPEKVLCGKSQKTRRINILPYTKSIHHFDGSWLDADVKEKRTAQEKLLQGAVLKS